MAKAASPVRLQANLMQAATLTGERFHRSASEQVEYWADIGRRVASVLDPDVLLSVSAGLARLKVEPVVGEPLDPDAVFQSLEAERAHGTLASAVTSSTAKYQASHSHPGFLERIQDDQVEIGQFQNGQFIIAAELAVESA
jgi:hypothetical protein